MAKSVLFRKIFAKAFQEVGTGNVSGSGTPNFLARWTTTTTLANSIFQDNGTETSIGVAPVTGTRLTIQGVGTTSATFGLKVFNSTGINNAFLVRNDGFSSFGSLPVTSTRLNIQGSGASSTSFALKLDTSTAGNAIAYFRNDRRVAIGTSTFAASTALTVDANSTGTGMFITNFTGLGFSIVSSTANIEGSYIEITGDQSIGHHVFVDGKQGIGFKIEMSNNVDVGGYGLLIDNQTAGLSDSINVTSPGINSNIFAINGETKIVYNDGNELEGGVLTSNSVGVGSWRNLYGTATTTDANASVQFSTTATNKKGLVLQGKALQTANLFEVQSSTGAILGSWNAAGGLAIGSAASATDAILINKTFTADTGLFNNAIGVNVISNQTSGIAILTALNLVATQSSGAATLPVCTTLIMGAVAASAGSFLSGFFVGAQFGMSSTVAQTGTIADAYIFNLVSPVYNGSKPSINFGINIQNQGHSGVVTSGAILIAAQTGSTNNYAILSASGNLHGFGTTAPTETVQVGGTFKVSSNIGFFGVNVQTQQASGANLTNNVTSGGVNDTIANFTDLTIYANDAATIRNDIYQLARKLKQVNDGLRTYGLLT